MPGQTYVCTSDAIGYEKGPVSQSSSPLVLRLTMSPSGDIIRVAAVTVVKVEAVKEPVPSQRSTRHESRIGHRNTSLVGHTDFSSVEKLVRRARRLAMERSG